MQTFWKVYKPFNAGPILGSARGKRTAKQITLAKRCEAFDYHTRLMPQDAHDTPEAALEAWRQQCAADVQACRDKLESAIALQTQEVRRK